MNQGILILFFSLIISVLSKAQIPNNGFENWTNINGYQTPDNWDNLNQITYNSSIYTCMKGTPGYSGASYLLLSSKTISGKGVVPGVAVCGTIDTVTYKPKSGFPFSTRPQFLSYYMQYMPYDPSDSSSVKVILTKWNQVLLKRDTIAFGASYFNAMAHSWFNNGTFLDYMSGNNPDSAIIVISSSGRVPKNGSYIYVDDLQFNGSVIGIDENSLNENNITVFPNPSCAFVTIHIDTKTDVALKLVVYDFKGKVVYEEILLHKNHTINTANWSKGIYNIQIKNKNNSLNKKLIIN